jgi:hypothetical protein
MSPWTFQVGLNVTVDETWGRHNIKAPIIYITCNKRKKNYYTMTKTIQFFVHDKSFFLEGIDRHLIFLSKTVQF